MYKSIYRCQRRDLRNIYFEEIIFHNFLRLHIQWLIRQDSEDFKIMQCYGWYGIVNKQIQIYSDLSLPWRQTNLICTRSPPHAPLALAPLLSPVSHITTLSSCFFTRVNKSGFLNLREIGIWWNTYTCVKDERKKGIRTRNINQNMYFTLFEWN